MFFSRAVVLALLLTGAPVALSAPAFAQSVPPVAASSASAPMTFSVNYKDNLLSVQSEGKTYLFAQAVTSPTVQLSVEFDKARHAAQASLQDEKGKKLWSGALLGDGVDLGGNHGSLQFKTGTDGGVTFSIARREASATEDNKGSKGKVLLTAKLGADNALLVVDMKADTGGAHFERLPDNTGMEATFHNDGEKDTHAVLRFGSENDPKITAEVNGEPIATARVDKANDTLTLTDTSGTVTLHTVKRDGKDYVEVQLGDRRLLVEGTSFSAQSKEGVIVLTVTPQAPAPPPAPTKP